MGSQAANLAVLAHMLIMLGLLIVPYVMQGISLRVIMLLNALPVLKVNYIQELFVVINNK